MNAIFSRSRPGTAATAFLAKQHRADQMTAAALDRPASTTPAIPEPPLALLAHIPGTDGWPVVGSTLALLADPKGEVERLAGRYGNVFRTRLFGGRTLYLLGPQANEFVLFDQAKTFSSTHGWSIFLERLFPRGLMLLDFDEHRLHRKALSVAFKTGPIKSYLASLNRGIEAGIASWRAGAPDMLFYPAIKQLTLDLAAVSFLGDARRGRGGGSPLLTRGASRRDRRGAHRRRSELHRLRVLRPHRPPGPSANPDARKLRQFGATGWWREMNSNQRYGFPYCLAACRTGFFVGEAGADF
jgi:Cytochrome P450